MRLYWGRVWEPDYSRKMHRSAYSMHRPSTFTQHMHCDTNEIRARHNLRGATPSRERRRPGALPIRYLCSSGMLGCVITNRNNHNIADKCRGYSTRPPSLHGPSVADLRCSQCSGHPYAQARAGRSYQPVVDCHLEWCTGLSCHMFPTLHIIPTPKAV